jgi:DNA repair protein RecN (Recombination protein N)
MNEINAADVRTGEDEELSSQLKMLQNSEKIYSSLSESYEILSASRLERCRVLLEDISEFSEEYSSISSTVNESVYALDDICEEIRRAKDSFSFTPDEIDTVISRLDVLDTLKKKYGGSLEKVLEYRDKCSIELEKFENTEEQEKELTMRLSSLRKKLLSLSEKLSRLRKAAAEKLSADMTSELSELNFANAQFAVNISPNVNSDGMPILSAEGTDVVEFLFNANKGGSLKPLSNVASGGEISRIALAFKRITNAAGSVPTLVFDEIDTGISGITASVVGRKLHEISEKHQVLCITHLPQIAACGDYQYLIARNDSDERSYTTIRLLSEEERIREIARLLGGTNITETTLASAGELLGFSH